MSKYQLVASYYDSATQTYQREIPITFPNIDLTTFMEIDAFTASTTKEAILNQIERTNQGTGQNHLAIKYQKNKNADPIYYQVIENNPNLVQLAQTTELKKYTLPDKQKITIVVNKDNPYYSREEAKLKEIIESKNISRFTSIYPYSNDFSFVVIRYMNSSYDEESARDRDFQMILSEFSRYKTFRGWIIANSKKKTESIASPSKGTKITRVYSGPKPQIKSQQEYEEEFLRQYQSQNNISWQEAQTQAYNSQYEEHLTPEEVEKMYQMPEETIAPNPSPKKIKKVSLKDSRRENEE